MRHIETIELASSAASITFSSIPQDYTDLVIYSSARTSRSAVNDGIDMEFNGSSLNRSTVLLRSNVTSTTLSNLRAGLSAAANSSTNTFGSSKVYISNYTASQPKSTSMETVTDPENSQRIELHAGLWNDTAAITSIELVGANASFVAGSTFSLYGITAGSDGTTTVT